MKYSYKATERFGKSFYALGSEQKESTRAAWELFKENPFDPRLNTHTIHRLSALWKHTVHSAGIEGDLRVVFRIDGSVVTTLDIGAHDIYK